MKLFSVINENIAVSLSCGVVSHPTAGPRHGSWVACHVWTAARERHVPWSAAKPLKQRHGAVVEASTNCCFLETMCEGDMPAHKTPSWPCITGPEGGWGLVGWGRYSFPTWRSFRSLLLLCVKGGVNQAVRAVPSHFISLLHLVFLSSVHHTLISLISLTPLWRISNRHSPSLPPSLSFLTLIMLPLSPLLIRWFIDGMVLCIRR